MSVPVKTVIVYHSGHCHTEKIAVAAARGAQAISGASADLVTAEEAPLSVFFTPFQASQAAGREFLKRFRLRAKDRDPEVNDKVARLNVPPSPNGPLRGRSPMII
jgi:hypothetical protein